MTESHPHATCELRRARAYLSRVAEPPAPALAELVADAGPLHAAALVAEARAPASVVTETAARHRTDLAAADLAAIAAAGGRLVIPEDDEWPAAAIADTPSLPPALWVTGTARLDELTPAVAVAGATAATGYGEHVAAELGHGLAARGIAVAAPAAYGIAAAAHRGALATANGRAIAVLATGHDQPGPGGLTRLLASLTERGAVVSAYPPGTRLTRHRLLAGTRLLAALTAATVVVEAGRRSRALTLAAAAAELGRAVLAVPGPVTSPLSTGCHQLLRDGAAVATGVDDVAVSCRGQHLRIAPS